MRKCDNYLGIYCYRYAPESFRAYFAKKEICLTAEERDECGTAYCTGGENAAVKALKRVIRKRERKEKLYVTYGNFYKNKLREYAFTQELATDGNDLRSRLYAYKTWKDYCQSRDWKLSTCIIEEGTVNPFDGKNKAIQREISEELDPCRKIKITFRTNTIYQN